MAYPNPRLDSFIIRALEQFVDPIPANHRELTYWFNNGAMAIKMGTNPLEAKEIALSTIKGMAAQGISADCANTYYKESFYTTTYQPPAEAPFPKFDKTTQKPLEGAAACLCQLLYQGRMEATEFQRVLNDPNVVKKYPATVDLLNQAIAFHQQNK